MMFIHRPHTPHCDVRLDTIKALIWRGAKVNATDEEGWTPLHFAAETGEMTMVEALLAGGADAAIRNKDGETPEDVARDNGAHQVAEVIRAAVCAQRNARGDAAGGRDARSPG